MTIFCRGLCDEDPRFRKSNGGKRKDGEKRCTVCGGNIMTDKLRCDCCRAVLRIAIHRKTRNQVQ